MTESFLCLKLFSPTTASHTPPPPILCQHPAYPSQPASNPISFKRSSLRSPTSVRMNHFPSYSTFFITAPKAFTSRVNYLYLSLYSLLSCEPQKGMSLIFLCVSFNPVIQCFPYYICYLLNDRLLCQKKTGFEKGQWKGGLSCANLYVSS